MSGEVSDQGMVKSLRIGQPDASKPLEQRNVQRLSFKGVREQGPEKADFYLILK